MSRKTKYFKTTTLAEQQRRQDNAMDRLMGCVPMNGKELRAMEFASVLFPAPSGPSIVMKKPFVCLLFIFQAV